MEIKPRIRSSLFHLRMEAKHRGQYQDNLRLRLGRIADETGETLAHLGRAQRPHRHFARWRGEKPPSSTARARCWLRRCSSRTFRRADRGRWRLRKIR